ncbi:MAG: galactokinase family protein, partial [Candidatus Thorarchaeota archaeon]
MIKIKSPGRICLFGEHQDYLSLPVISMAISKYIYLEAYKINETKFLIELPDIQQHFEMQLDKREQEYTTNRDYIKSGYNQLIRRGIKFKTGYKVKISGDLPINAGVASSSALIIAWLHFLNLISNQRFNLHQLALMGYDAEVTEFNEGGGMMDHYSAAYGNLLYLNPSLPKPNVTNYDLILQGFVLGDSTEKKNTVDDLINIKKTCITSIEIMKKIYPNFNQFQSKLKEVAPFLPNLNREYQKKIKGILINRDLTLQAKALIDT